MPVNQRDRERAAQLVLNGTKDIHGGEVIKRLEDAAKAFSECREEEWAFIIAKARELANTYHIEHTPITVATLLAFATFLESKGSRDGIEKEGSQEAFATQASGKCG